MFTANTNSNRGLQHQPTAQTLNPYKSMSLIEKIPKLVSIYEKEWDDRQRNRSNKNIEWNKKNNIENQMKMTANTANKRRSQAKRQKKSEEKLQKIHHHHKKTSRFNPQKINHYNLRMKNKQSWKNNRYVENKNEHNADFISEDNFNKFLDLEDYSSIQKNQSLHQNLDEFEEDKEYAKYLMEFPPKLVKKIQSNQPQQQQHPNNIAAVDFNNHDICNTITSEQVSPFAKIKGSEQSKSAYFENKQNMEQIMPKAEYSKIQKKQRNFINKKSNTNLYSSNKLGKCSSLRQFNAYETATDLLDKCIDINQFDESKGNIKISEQNMNSSKYSHHPPPPKHIDTLTKKHLQQNKNTKSAENVLRMVLLKKNRLLDFLQINNQLQVCLHNLDYDREMKDIQKRNDIFMKISGEDDDGWQRGGEIAQGIRQYPATGLSLKSACSLPPPQFTLSFSKCDSSEQQPKRQNMGNVNILSQLTSSQHSKRMKPPKNKLKQIQVLDMLAILLIKLSTKKCTFYYKNKCQTKSKSKSKDSKVSKQKTNRMSTKNKQQAKQNYIHGHHEILSHKVNKKYINRDVHHPRQNKQHIESLEQIISRLTVVTSNSQFTKIEFEEYLQPKDNEKTMNNKLITHSERIAQLKIEMENKNKEMEEIISECDQIVSNYFHSISHLQQKIYGNKIKKQQKKAIDGLSEQPGDGQDHHKEEQHGNDGHQLEQPQHSEGHQEGKEAHAEQQHIEQQPMPQNEDNEDNYDLNDPNNNNSQSPMITNNSLSVSMNKTQNNKPKQNKSTPSNKTWH